MPKLATRPDIPMLTRSIDWHQYMDGQEWVFEEGEDYDPGQAKAVQASAHNWCSRNNNGVRFRLSRDPKWRDPEVRTEYQQDVVKVRTRVIKDGAAVRVRAYFPYRVD